MSLPEGLNLEVSIDCTSWKKTLPDYEAIISKSVEMIFLKLPEGPAINKFPNIELGVVLCDDARIRKLNREYRGNDSATNVLSFEGLSVDQRDDYFRSDKVAPNSPFSLGEIYIAFQTMEKEADDAAISLGDHFSHMIIHGILHLFGYDHIQDEEAEIMEAHERCLLSHLGIDDPYAA